MERQEQPRAQVIVIALVALTLVGSALGAIAVRSDLLIGRSPSSGRPVRECGAVPAAEPDTTPFLPGHAANTVLGMIPPPPVPDLAEPKVLAYREYGAPAQYAQFTSLLLPSTVTKAMAENGLSAVSTIGYQAGPTFFGVEAMRFATTDGAAAYARAVLLAECENGVAGGVRPLPGVARGAMFTYHHDLRPPFRASFVVGDTAVRANLCICRKGSLDPYQVLEAWVQDMAHWMRGPSQ